MSRCDSHVIVPIDSPETLRHVRDADHTMCTVATATEETVRLLGDLGARTEFKGFPGNHTHAMGDRLA